MSAEPPLAGLNRLFVRALLALARAGEADAACRIAAQGWSLLRHHDAREAERLTAALHSLSHGARLDLPQQGESHHGRSSDSGRAHPDPGGTAPPDLRHL